MEATSHGARLGRLGGVRFSALGFTNLSRDHLDFHGTVDEYFAAKRSLFVTDDPPPAEDSTPEVPDQPLGPPAELDDDEAPLPGVPEREPPASE